MHGLLLHETSPEPRLWDPGLSRLFAESCRASGMDGQDLGRELLRLWQEAFHSSLSRGLALAAPELSPPPFGDPGPEEAASPESLDPCFPESHPLFSVMGKSARARLSPLLGPVRAMRLVCEAARGFFTFARKAAVGHPGAGGFLSLLEERYKKGEGPFLAHMNEVLGRFQARPMPLSGTIPLHRAYVVPRALRRRHEAGLPDGAPQEVRDLIAALLADLGREPLPIVIHGLPGHGKTSAALALAHALAPEGDEQGRGFLFYEFKSLAQLGEGGQEVLRRSTPFVRGEEFFHGKKLVLILDGMDDCRPSDGPDLFFKDFVRDLARLARRVNRRADSRLDLVMTGRSRFFFKVKASLPAPFVEYGIEDFDEARVSAWLLNFSGEQGLSKPLRLKDLEENDLDELAGQPVLLCLTALLISDGACREQLAPAAGPDPRSVYRTIVSWTFHKLWHQDPRPADFPDLDSYQALLRAAAFILHQEGADSIPMDRLATRLAAERERHLLSGFLPREPDRVRSACEKLALLFFVAPGPGMEFSFIHETFRHHLCAEEMFSLLAAAVSDFRPERAEACCRRMAPELYEIFGAGPISEELMDFCRPVMAARSRESKSILEALTAFFPRAQERRYLAGCLGKNGSDPFRAQACVLHGIFTWTAMLRRVLKEKGLINGNLPPLFAEKTGLARLIAALAAAGQSPARGYALNLSDCDMDGQDLSRLALTASSMENASLRRAKLSGASLAGSFLLNARLEECDLSNADLSGAYLDRAQCRGADFSRALFRDARLDRATLREANLSSALFIRTDLSGADLSGAELAGALFLDADLKGVRWDGANRKDAFFISTRKK